jgi:hypothetical protein
MANSASITTLGVIIPPVPQDLVTQCVTALSALEQQFGTASLERAIDAWKANKDVRARLNFLHADEDAQQVIGAIAHARRLGDDELADMIETEWKASAPRPVAEPLPPLVELAVAQ